MIVGLLHLDLHLQSVHSLKEKRQILRSLMTRLRNRFNVAVAEVEHQDLWQRARLAVVSVNSDREHLLTTLRAASAQAEGDRSLTVLDDSVEIL
ncbi:MAG: DUF503 domain-containing protein [Vicinamibacteria bacterium]|nr:DUF503 domain-containing protein [Vicinamibacteria bacterium]